jgi:hypothetical protein
LAGTGIPPETDQPWLNWVGEIPTTVAQRLACDCDIFRIVLDPASGLPLDVGDKHRIFPDWMRKAILARDRRCRWPGCEAPAEWLDIHHVWEWWKYRRTRVDEGSGSAVHTTSRCTKGNWSIPSMSPPAKYT